MPNVIYLKSDKSFRGPYTDDPPLLPGETKVTLTDPQFAEFDAVVRPDPAGFERIVLFDATASPCFYRASLPVCAQLAPTLRWGLMFCFAQISTEAKRARLRPMHASLARLFDDNGDNGGACVNEAKYMMQNVDVSDDSELTAIKNTMISLPQWGAGSY